MGGDNGQGKRECRPDSRGVRLSGQRGRNTSFPYYKELKAIIKMQGKHTHTHPSFRGGQASFVVALESRQEAGRAAGRWTLRRTKGHYQDRRRKQREALPSDSLGPGHRGVLVFSSGAGAADHSRRACAGCGGPSWLGGPAPSFPPVSGPGQEVRSMAVVRGQGDRHSRAAWTLSFSPTADLG